VRLSKDVPEPLVVDQETAARMLGVSVSTLRRWDRDGKGPRAIKFSRLVRYRPADLQRFLRTPENVTGRSR
jgi:predicted site-specific integrase-resolvase